MTEYLKSKWRRLGAVQQRLLMGMVLVIGAGLLLSIAASGGGNGKGPAWKDEVAQELQARDTDADGFTDYEELVSYGTDPLLATDFPQALATISAGDGHSLYVMESTEMLSWGDNASGQLGIGTFGSLSTSPVKVHGPGDIGLFSNIVECAAGGEHSLALNADGTVWAWGKNAQGRLGDGAGIDQASPVQVHGPGDIGLLEDIATIVAGASHSLAVKTDGTVWAWGKNSSGCLGDDTKQARSTPVQVLTSSGNLTNIVSAAAGDKHSVALDANGGVWAWGENGSGQLGNGSSSDEKTAVQVSGPGGVGLLSDIVAVAAGDKHTLALKADGTVLAWGENGSGRLGDNTTTDRDLPVQVHGSGDIGFLSNIVAIAAGDSHSCYVPHYVIGTVLE